MRVNLEAEAEEKGMYRKQGSHVQVAKCCSEKVWKCMGINGETLQLHASIGCIIYGAVYKKPLIFTTSHVRIRIWYYKSCVLHQNKQ